MYWSPFFLWNSILLWPRHKMLTKKLQKINPKLREIPDMVCPEDTASTLCRLCRVRRLKLFLSDTHGTTKTVSVAWFAGGITGRSIISDVTGENCLVGSTGALDSGVGNGGTCLTQIITRRPVIPGVTGCNFLIGSTGALDSGGIGNGGTRRTRTITKISIITRVAGENCLVGIRGALDSGGVGNGGTRRTRCNVGR